MADEGVVRGGGLPGGKDGREDRHLSQIRVFRMGRHVLISFLTWGCIYM